MPYSMSRENVRMRNNDDNTRTTIGHTYYIHVHMPVDGHRNRGCLKLRWRDVLEEDCGTISRDN